MAILLDAVSRRSLLKLLFALPLAGILEKFMARLIGWRGDAAAAAGPLKVAKVSELKHAWDSARFTYSVKVRTKDVYNQEMATEEVVPGLVIRLPDDLAAKRGGDPKAKFYVVDLHCTHERCVTGYLTDKGEVRAVASIEAKAPVAYCPCHRSVFDLAEEGKVVKGPAKEPLWKFAFDVKGDDIVITGLDPKASTWGPGRAGGLTSEYPVRPGEPGL